VGAAYFDASRDGSCWRPLPIIERLFAFAEFSDAALRKMRRGKSAEDFAWRRVAKGQKDNYCRPCRSAYKKEHYASNRRKYIDAAGERRRSLLAKRTAFMVEYLRDRPCTDRGEDDPIVLEFDHLRDKKFSISSGIRARSWQSVLDEMAKCEVVCANCHRRRTARRGGFARAAVAQR
jgi:hypothetical protein